MLRARNRRGGVVGVSLRGSARILVAADARGVVEERADAVLERLDLRERAARRSHLGLGAVPTGFPPSGTAPFTPAVTAGEASEMKWYR